MSTSFLYHTFNIQGFKHKRERYEGSRIIFETEAKPGSFRCACCKSYNVIRKGGQSRDLRCGRISGKLAFLRFFSHRLLCKDCGACRQMKLSFAEPKKSYIRAFSREVIGLSQKMAIQDVADYLDVSWHVIKEIQKESLRKKFRNLKLKEVTHIAIDEICIGKGRDFVTLVMDLVSGAILYMEDGKSGNSLELFWRRLKRSGAVVEAVAIDMSPAYHAAVSKNLPDAAIVFDHFHVVKLMNEKIANLRRHLWHKADSHEERNILKGTRWLLLKCPENLDEEKGEWPRLSKALELNSSLAIAYYLKEDLRQLWSQANKEVAERFLRAWCARAEESGISVLRKFGRKLLGARSALLAYYDYPISTGPLEATNNKVKLIQRQAYGFRDREFFRLKVFASHDLSYKLVG
ncbi:MAG: ISL3 family transposase [Planctomycetes bacterium]|nr:ISL3 family transposase [Planctomycetota bacterium]